MTDRPEAPADEAPKDQAPEDAETPHTPVARAVLDQMGGISGLIQSSLPIVVLIPVSNRWGLAAGVGAALGVAALVLAWRLWRGESAQPAVSGFIGVGVSGLIAFLVGSTKGYFLYGIWMSLAWALVFAVSVLIRRPIVGYAWSALGGHGSDWRGVRRAVWAFDLATLGWVLVFAARFAVQRHLYNLDETGWLGVVRIAMGWPLTAVAALATFVCIRAAQRAVRRGSAEWTGA
ncbi:MAG: DUF3159 domain-containing protein [Mycolicibacterium insubricum]